MSAEFATQPFLDRIDSEFKKIIDRLRTEFAALQIGRASAVLVENLQVEAYGTKQSLKGLAQIVIPDARSIRIQPWDRSTLGAIEKAIQISDLHLTPTNDGTMIHLNISPLTEERRNELTKVVRRIAEDAKISVRNARQDVHSAVRDLEHAKQITEDDRRLAEKELQDRVTKANTEIESMMGKKEEEVMKI